jgi:hypothetical protein
MTYEILLVIAALCSTSGEYASTTRLLASNCQKQMIICVEEKPSAEKIAECVKKGETKP